jgi:hypothetical protein
VLRLPAHRKTSVGSAKTLGINPANIQTVVRTEEFLWAQAPPVAPSSISSANVFRIHLSGTARIAMTLPPIPAGVSASLLEPAQEPIPSDWAIETPTPDGASLERTLRHTTAFLQPRGIAPASRTLACGPRELPLHARRVPEFRRDGRTGTVRSAHPSGTWEFAAQHAFTQRVVWVSSTEDIHAMETRVQAPGLPARLEPLLSNGPFAKVHLGAKDQRREQAETVVLAGIQRFRAIALVQIREPELQNSAPSDLPVLSTSLRWPGIRMVAEFPLGATPVPLRPPLQTPAVC